MWSPKYVTQGIDAMKEHMNFAQYKPKIVKARSRMYYNR
jgi:hypothetical protein